MVGPAVGPELIALPSLAQQWGTAGVAGRRRCRELVMMNVIAAADMCACRGPLPAAILVASRIFAGYASSAGSTRIGGSIGRTRRG